jgi:hypothetical protein
MTSVEARSPQAPAVFRAIADYVAVVDPALSATASDSRVVPVAATLLFRPRLPKGYVAHAKDFPVTPDVDAVQTLTVVGSPTGGTWKAQVLGNWTPNPIVWNATPAQVQTAFEAIPGVGVGNVLVTAGVNPLSYRVTFTKLLGHQVVPLIVTDAKLLTGLKGATFAVTAINTVYGAAARRAPAGVVIPQRQGRLWQGRLCSIDVADTPGVELVAADPILSLPDGKLIYDVDFTDVVWAGKPGDLQNFAFVAPKVGGGEVCLTDPALATVPWDRP